MTDLTDRMRTCAAAIMAGVDKHFHGDPSPLYTDAADLLLEASNALENVPKPLGEPMAILAAMPTTVTPTSIDPPDKLVEQYKAATGWANPAPKAVWITNAGDLPPVPAGSKPAYRPPRVCPACDSRANKRVFRQDNTVFLACPVCAHAWEYKP